MVQLLPRQGRPAGGAEPPRALFESTARLPGTSVGVGAVSLRAAEARRRPRFTGVSTQEALPGLRRQRGGGGQRLPPRRRRHGRVLLPGGLEGASKWAGGEPRA